MISVIVPTCNRTDLLKTCLTLLAPESQELDCKLYEVIVTDDSSNDLSKELINSTYPWAKWIRGPRKGPAANRNNGANQATGEWLVFIDDDCIPDRRLLENYKRAFSKYPKDQVFEGSIIPDSWNLLKKDMAECPVNTAGDCFWSANICIKKSLFEVINGFDESYLIAAQEDQQLKIDIEAFTKRKIKFLKECVVTHPVRFNTLIRQIKKIPVQSRNYSIYAIKNKDRLKLHSLLKFTINQYAFHGKRFARLIRSGRPKSALISLAWVIYGVPLNILNTRVRRQTVSR